MPLIGPAARLPSERQSREEHGSRTKVTENDRVRAGGTGNDPDLPRARPCPLPGGYARAAEKIGMLCRAETLGRRDLDRGNRAGPSSRLASALVRWSVGALNGNERPHDPGAVDLDQHGVPVSHGVPRLARRILMPARGAA